MAQNQNDELGHYVISFFDMHVKTDQDDMSLDNLSDQDLVAFFHEYIHFLQDFTTYHGLYGLYAKCEYLRQICNMIYNRKCPMFKVPVVIDGNPNNVPLNRSIQEFVYGDVNQNDDSSNHSNPNRSFDIEKIELWTDDISQSISNDNIKEIPSYAITLKDGDIFIFGAGAIRENLAYLMERLCAPDSFVKSPVFPYLAAEKVADFIVKDFSKDPLMVLALCDMSLMFSNPGKIFVDTLFHIQEGELRFNSPEDIYNHFYQALVEYVDGGMQLNLITAFLCFLNSVSKQIKDYLKNEVYATQYYDWIDRLTAFAINWRQNDRYFLLKMARQTDLRNNCYFTKTVNKVGTPLISNSIPGQYYKNSPDGYSSELMDVEFFKAIREIYLLFEKASTKCSMYEWCSNSPRVQTDERCTTAPWTRCNDKQLCPYAMIWRHWGLSGITPTCQ